MNRPQPSISHVRPTIWQHPFVQQVLPFLTSMALHVGLIVLGIATVRIVSTPPRVTLTDATVIPDDMGMEDDAPKVFNDDVLRDRTTDWSTLPALPVITAPDIQIEPKKVGDGSRAVDGNAEGVEMTGPAVIGLSPRGRLGRPGGDGSQIGFGWRKSDGTIFGRPQGGSAGRRLPKVVYVCDASGSMLRRFDDLRRQLRLAITALRPSQPFNVVFFHDKPHAANPASLIIPTPSGKAKAFEFLENVSAYGQTNPIPAIELAFRQNPDVVFLLTDGDFPDNEAVAQWIRQHNARKVVIHTIAYVNRDDSYAKALKQIADENRGTFKFVGDDELGN